MVVKIIAPNILITLACVCKGQCMYVCSVEFILDQNFNQAKPRGEGSSHLGWPGGIGLRSGSVLFLKILGSILSGVNLGGLI